LLPLKVVDRREVAGNILKLTKRDTEQIQREILSAVIQDDKPRDALGLTAFGDIFFKEDNGCGQELFSICRTLPPTRPVDKPARKGEFMFKVHILAVGDNAFKSFLKIGRPSLFGRRTSENMQLLHDETISRYDLAKSLKLRLGSPKADEVYGYCASDDYNSTNHFAEIISKESYLAEVLTFAKEHRRSYYDDIYTLTGSSDFGALVQKRYLGYGFRIPDALFECISLKSLAIYNQFVKKLTADRLLVFKNLNALALNDVGSLHEETVDAIHKLPYLVELSLSNAGDFHGTELKRLPRHLDKLNNLRIFDFSGQSFADGSSIAALKSLRELRLTQCRLSQIFDNIGALAQLEVLNLANNEIHELPESLKALKKLKVLNLSKNPLVRVPEWLGEMTQLEELWLSQCQLTALPEIIAELSNLKLLELRKNPFEKLPGTMVQFPKKVVKLALRDQALYDAKAKAKLETYPKGNFLFENDFNLKLMVINQLMYVDEVLLPKFEVWEWAQTYTERAVDIEKEGYDEIAEVRAIFKRMEIPMELLIDITELKPDGGDRIYSQLVPFWDGEDNRFEVASVEDIDYLPNLKATNKMNFSKDLVKELRARKIKVSNY